MSKPIKKQTWSNLDVFGLLNGLSIWDEQYKNLKYVRKPYENNLELRDKITKTHYNPPDINKQGLLNALCNEFGLEPYKVSKKTIFELSFNPIPSGAIGVQDISGFYKNSDGDWISIGPQLWSDSYDSAKITKNGFLVWQQDRFATIPQYKNFSYSNLVEVFREFDDNTELKFIYYVEGVDENNNRTLIQFTDMNSSGDINDTRFTYKKEFTDINLSGDIVIYTLNDIPENIRTSIYYDETTGMAKEFLYNLKTYIDKKFKHTWDKLTTNTCIWDIHKNYGSGHLPHFYDAIAPYNFDTCRTRYSGYIGGIESLSYSLYPTDVVESGDAANWYFKIYPGKFYIDGISFYWMENQQINNLDFNLVDTGTFSGCYSGIIPSGLTRGMYTILAKSGYYDLYCNLPRNQFLSGVYEDFSYYTGIDGDSLWSNILGRVPMLTAEKGYDLPIEIGQYTLDFQNRRIYAKVPPTLTQLTLVWDKTLVPSGKILEYDLNPLNDSDLNFEKFFLYLSLDPNRR